MGGDGLIYIRRVAYVVRRSETWVLNFEHIFETISRINSSGQKFGRRRAFVFNLIFCNDIL